MEIQQLKYFVQAARRGSFREAADDLFVSRAALSKSMGRLEGELGYELFERNRDGVDLTPAGKRFYAQAAPLVEDYDRINQAVRAQQEKTRDIAKKLPLHELNLTGFNGENMLKLFDSKKWGELSQACLGCGTCTFVCPTCQCYDIRDFNTGSGITRFRCWDSCMYSDFTKMSAGQPRPTQLERFRQRFMHKLVYFPDNNDGCFGCVGCGRCLAKCPIHMNIVKVAKTLGGAEA